MVRLLCVPDHSTLPQSAMGHISRDSALAGTALYWGIVTHIYWTIKSAFWFLSSNSGCGWLFSQADLATTRLAGQILGYDSWQERRRKE